MKDYRLYILMRTDLPSMGPGRAAAQSSHATSAFTKTFGPYSKLGRQEVKDWMRMTKQGFGTAIVLGVTKAQIEDIFNRSPIKDWIMKEKVYDPDYTIRVNYEIADLLDQNYDSRKCNFKINFSLSDDKTAVISRSEMTCAYVFGDKEDLIECLGNLPLYTGNE